MIDTWWIVDLNDGAYIASVRSLKSHPDFAVRLAQLDWQLKTNTTQPVTSVYARLAKPDEVTQQVVVPITGGAA